MKNFDELKYIKSMSDIIDKMSDQIAGLEKNVQTNQRKIMLLIISNIILWVLLIIVFIIGVF